MILIITVNDIKGIYVNDGYLVKQDQLFIYDDALFIFAFDNIN